jgi:hypothetical protein
MEKPPQDLATLSGENPITNPPPIDYLLDFRNDI